MSTRAALISLVLIVASGPLSAQQSSGPLKFDQGNYDAIRTSLALEPVNAYWREIPWHPDLISALHEAKRKPRPILLWVMNGHPCGMT